MVSGAVVEKGHFICTIEINNNQQQRGIMDWKLSDWASSDQLDPEAPGQGHILPLGKGSVAESEAHLRNIQERKAEKERKAEETRRQIEFETQEHERKRKEAKDRAAQNQNRTLRRRKQARQVLGEYWGSGDAEAGGEIRAWIQVKQNWFWFLDEVWSRAKFPLMCFLVLVLLLWSGSMFLDLYRRAYGIDEYGAAPDPSRIFTDRFGRGVVDPVHPHMLRPEENDVDAGIARWILREAEFWRLSKAQIALGWVEVWLYGARRARNVSLAQVQESLEKSQHSCACAAHLGVPIHALKVGSIFMVEPKEGARSSASRSWTFEDRLNPGTKKTIKSANTLWVDYSDARGTNYVKLMEKGAVACVQHCAEIVSRARDD